MNQGQAITVEQVVRETIGILEGIRVPVGMAQEITVPISQAVHNLRLCMDAWARDAAANAQQAQEEPEITIEPVEEGGKAGC